MGGEIKGETYSGVIERLPGIVAAQVRPGVPTGVSIALVDDQTIVYAGGFGMADEECGVAAGAETVYRVGSVSKLFNALAVMQLVEQGRLDLDAPIARYAPEFSIVVPFADAAPITLRQLLCHRSGMIRECPTGSYFDDTSPTIEATVRSVAPCVLVNPPNTKTCYSNVGPTIAGHIVSKVSGLDYEEYQQRHVLGPMGMSNAGFRMNAKIAAAAARGYMNIALPGSAFRREPAPQFELGTLPAGNMYAPATDLARLAMLVFANGRSNGQQIIRPETLAEMLRPQLTNDAVGFGIGFNIAKFGAYAAVGHNGALYGFTSLLLMLPEVKLGVVVLANDDLVLGAVRAIAEPALELMLEAKLGVKPTPPPTVDLAPAQLARLAGEYESLSYWATLRTENGHIEAVVSGQPLTLTLVEPLRFLASGRWQFRAEVVFTESTDGNINEFQMLGQTFKRVAPTAVTPPPAAWQQYVGSYGPAFIPLVVSIRHGHLYAFTENMVDYRLKPINRTVFAMPPGLYTDEQLVFQVGPDGRVYGATLANVDMKRHP